MSDHPDLVMGVARAWGGRAPGPADWALRVTGAGADQFGGEDCTEVLLGLVRDGRVSESRIDESVRRICCGSRSLGFVEHPFVDEEYASITLGSSDFRDAGLAPSATR